MDAAKTTTGDVTSRDLFWRWEHDGTQERLSFEDQGEQRVILDLTAVFEPVIDEVFDQDGYANVVAHSRSKMRDSTDG